MHKILIVDDDPLTAKIYRDFLERSSFEVQTVADGVQALAVLENSTPDAFVVDIMMPKLNGIELIKRVRAIERFNNTPMLAYTTAFVPQLIQQTKDAGANDIFDKAKLNGPLLKSALQQYLRTGAV